MELNSSNLHCNDTVAWIWLSSLQPPFLTLISILGVVGNSLVLCVFCLQRKPCSVADVYLGNLAAADLIMVLCLPFWTVTIAQGYQWNFGQLLCKVINTAISMNYYCSILFLMLVSVDRYLALAKPLNPSKLRCPKWAKHICVVIWVVGFMLSLPAMIFRRVNFVPLAGVEACYLDYPHPAWVLQRNLTTNFIGFLLPLPVISLCTFHVIKALKNRGLLIQRRVQTERKATQLVLTVLAVFLLCWTPFQLASLAAKRAKKSHGKLADRAGCACQVRYVVDFLELANQLSWPNASLGVVFPLGLDERDFSLIEFINLIIYLNGSNFEIDEVKEDRGSSHPDPCETRRVVPAHPTAGTPTHRTNSSDRLPSPKHCASSRVPSSSSSLAQNRRPPFSAQARLHLIWQAKLLLWTWHSHWSLKPLLNSSGLD
ncbi:hypothetical protein Q8A67_017284 [Cirrhinus molitorella]|uniref:G-protein coupled receptors family 1 profile domain-containing protein n=1 Tax=Cirrhinus molitorella TaxID=172907 RepID=A0AA88PAS6_9TELE|nr:hypothetical protein Q8A67_017284 [Cirrhinus molitorella]